MASYNSSNTGHAPVPWDGFPSWNSTDAEFPSVANSTLIRTLSGLREQTVTLLCGEGNRALGLAHDGARTLLSHVGVTPIELAVGETPSSAADNGVLLVSSAGIFCGRGAGVLADSIRKLAPRFKRIVLLPGSYDPAIPAVTKLIREADKRYTIFCRDFVSMDRLRSLKAQVGQLLVGHDLGFHVDLTRWETVPGAGEGGIFRRDGDGLPDRRLLKFNKSDACVGSPAERDILIDHIASLETVHTDHLQVALAAARLHRQVVLYRTQSFGNLAVYEHSLKPYENVTLAGPPTFSVRRFTQNVWWGLWPAKAA